MTATRSNKRLIRILKLIPFLQKNPGVSVKDTATLFEVSEKELIADLNLIWLCGLPGYTHLELIDVSYDSGFITISNADTLPKPMRITFDEGAALLLAITKLSEIAPLGDSKTLITLREKLSKLLSIDTFESKFKVYTERNSPLLPELKKAIGTNDVLMEVDYYSLTLDEVLRIRVRPLEIETIHGHLYLIAILPNDRSYKYFRIDRIVSAWTAGASPSDGEVIANYSLNAADTAEASAVSEPTEADIEITRDGFWFIQKWGMSALQYDQNRGVFAGSIVVYNPRWLERASLSAAGLMEVIAPQESRRQVASAAMRTLEKYGNRLK